MAEFASISIHHPGFQGSAKRWGLFRILLSLYWKSKFRPNQAVTQKLWGWRFSGESPQSFFFLFWEIFIEESYSFQSKDPSLKIIDGGANIGLSIAYFKMHYPDAEITAFEPSPQAFSYLKANVERSRFKKVQLIQAALSDQVGSVTLWTEPEAPLYNASLFPSRNADKAQEVKACLLSDFLSKSNFDLVKLDIEGAERMVIQDLSRNDLLSQSKSYIIEYHPKYHLPDEYTELIQAFKNSGFNLSRKVSRNSGSATDEVLHFERFA